MHCELCIVIISSRTICPQTFETVKIARLTQKYVNYHVDIVDENGNKTGERDLVVGEEVVPYKTNNVDTVYIRDKDDNILMFHETNEWPRQVDGIDIETIFDNILYAG